MFGARFAVFVRRARVLPIPSQATRNLSFLEVSPAPSRCCFKSLFMWTGTGCIEFPTEWNLYKRARARSGASCACVPHGLQCLHDGRACCPSLPKQLVISRFLRFHGRRHVVVSSRCFTGTGTGCIEIPTEWNLFKRARARSGASCACLAHGLQCLRDRRACCPSLPKQLVICRFLRFHGRRHVVVSSRCFMWTGTGWIEIPTKWNLYKRVRARGDGA